MQLSLRTFCQFLDLFVSKLVPFLYSFTDSQWCFVLKAQERLVFTACWQAMGQHVPPCVIYQIYFADITQSRIFLWVRWWKLDVLLHPYVQTAETKDHQVRSLNLTQGLSMLTCMWQSWGISGANNLIWHDGKCFLHHDNTAALWQ